MSTSVLKSNAIGPSADASVTVSRHVSETTSAVLLPGTPSPLITEAEKAHFREFGFVALQRITSPADVASIRATVESLFKTKAGYRQGARLNFVGAADDNDDVGIPQILGPRHYASILRESEFFRNASAIARELLGPEARFAGDHTLVKPALVGPASPWHQDESFRNPHFEYNEISFWMPLQPVNQVNGCMEYIPGSHLGEVLPHRSLNNDASIHSLECHEGFNPAEAVACPMPAGGCALHTTRTLHYAGPNRSDQPRYAYVLIFAIPATPTRKPRDFPWLVGKDTGHLKRMRQWILRGGLFVLLWRMFREINLRDIKTVIAKLRMRVAVFTALWRKKKAPHESRR